MASLAPSSLIAIDQNHRELHFAIGGFWTLETMNEFLTDLARATKPFFKKQQSYSALGDLRDFVPQSRETADAIRDSLLMAAQNGLTRFAVVTTSTLVVLQYKRLTDGIDVGFFEDPRSAERWLREGR